MAAIDLCYMVLDELSKIAIVGTRYVLVARPQRRLLVVSLPRRPSQRGILGTERLL
jgi:hypothetical protein